MKTAGTGSYGVRNAPAAGDPGAEDGKWITVCLAPAADLVNGMPKAVDDLVAMSAALLAEAAQSVADVLDELPVLAALRRSSRLLDARHRFGHGKERMLRARLAVVGIFVTGCCFSLCQGLPMLLEREPGLEVLASSVGQDPGGAARRRHKASADLGHGEPMEKR